MTGGPAWGPPRRSIEAECARRGRAAVVAGCVRLIGGDDSDTSLILTLGGPHAARVLHEGLPDVHRYWLRVWAVRGLLWAWEDSGLPGVRAALDDPAWRVREMAAKVVARHRLDDLLERVAALRDDPVPRVRTAAARAVAVLTRAGT